MNLYRAHAVDDDHPEQYGFHWDPEWRLWLAWMASLPDDLPFDVELLKKACYSSEVHSPTKPEFPQPQVINESLLP